MLAAVLLLADEAADAGLDDDVAFADRELEVALPAAAIETGFALGATAGGAAGAAFAETLAGAGAEAVADVESTTTIGALATGGACGTGALVKVEFAALADGEGALAGALGCSTAATTGRFTAFARDLGTKGRPPTSLSSFSGGRSGNALSGTQPSMPPAVLILTKPFTRLVISTNSPHLSLACTSKLFSESYTQMRS